MKIESRLYENIDWMLLGLVSAIVCLGLLNLYSACYNSPSGMGPFIRQIYWVVIGLVFMVLFMAVDYHFLVRYGYVIYAVSILLLLAVFFGGKVVQGSQRWLSMGGVSFQPSELMKIAIIVALSKYLGEQKINGSLGPAHLIVPFLLVFVPFLLILKQPDLGTASFLFVVSSSIVLFVGIQRWLFFVLSIAGACVVPLGWFFLKEYQRQRILTFLNPELDPLGAGYHIIQSIIAIGSGGFAGKGLLRGTQSQLKFLPEQQTDFVFSVFAEEWGFLGVALLLGLFFALVLWGFKIARQSRDASGMIVAFGVTAYIFWGVFINIGMVIGLFPVVGIPLPFVSYGGSSMVVLMICVGFLMNVSMRRFILQS